MRPARFSFPFLLLHLLLPLPLHLHLVSSERSVGELEAGFREINLEMLLELLEQRKIRIAIV